MGYRWDKDKKNTKTDIFKIHHGRKLKTTFFVIQYCGIIFEPTLLQK